MFGRACGRLSYLSLGADGIARGRHPPPHLFHTRSAQARGRSHLVVTETPRATLRLVTQCRPRPAANLYPSDPRAGRTRTEDRS